jgi:hypothetical protein
MRHGDSIVLPVLALMFALAHGAQGATLWTPSLAPAGMNTLRCDIQNVGSKRLDVSIDVLEFDGAVVSTGQTFAPPGGSTAWYAPASDNPRTCRFRFRGSKRKVRASACVYQSDLGCIAAVSAQ